MAAIRDIELDVWSDTVMLTSGDRVCCFWRQRCRNSTVMAWIIITVQHDSVLVHVTWAQGMKGLV